jgi:RING-box protein 2
MEVDEELPASGDLQGAKKEEKEKASKSKSSKAPAGPMFTLKKWNAVAMWQWDVECDTCAICRVQVMGELVFICDDINIILLSIHHIKRKCYDSAL